VLGGPPTKPEVADLNQGVADANREDVEGVASSTPAVQFDRPERATSTPRERAWNASYGGARPAPTQSAADSRPQEIATEFIPLMQEGQYAQTEEGHLVRVELPRSALASFGIPVSAEAPAGRVKADVLLGEDGTARAIRFIR
jgi:hypothetical protein